MRKTPAGQRKRRRFESLEPRGDFCVADFQRQLAVRNVEVNDVAFAHRGDRAADEGFGGDVAGSEAARRAGEAAVGEQSNVRAEFGIRRDGRGHLQHFAHARATLGSFIANHKHIARLDLAGLHGCKAGFFAVEDACRAAMLEAIGSGNLHHAAFGREIAFENDETAGWFDRFFEGVDDDLAGRFLGERGLFSQGAAADGERRAIGVARVDESLGQQARTARSLIIRCHVFSRWRQGRR